MGPRSTVAIAILLGTSGVAHAGDVGGSEESRSRSGARGHDAERAPVAEPHAALGFFTGAMLFVTGFGIGGAIIATGDESTPGRDRAGWLTIESAFVFAPIAGHAITSEWTRGLVFAAVPASVVGGTAGVFALDPRAVRHAPLSEQRVLWGLFTAAMFVSAAGVVDAALAGERVPSLTIAPSAGTHQVGIEIGGTL